MNERIIRLALNAGLLNYVDNETPPRYFIHGHADLEEVQRFANLVLEEHDKEQEQIRNEIGEKIWRKAIREEREACAITCENLGYDPEVEQRCAAAIRARIFE